MVIVLLTSTMMSDNGRAGKTGSPGEATCIDCHSDYSVNMSGGSIAIAGITGGTYTPGTTYNLSVTVARSGMTVFGLGVEALNAANSPAGTFVVTNSAETQIKNATVSSVVRPNLVHQLDGGATNNTHTFNFNWTAPAAGTGNVTLYYAGIAGDHDGNEAGDYVYNGSLALTEGGGCTTPAQPGTITGTAAVCAGSSQTYSIAAVSGATDYIWTLPSGWSGSSTTTSITVTAGAAGGTITVAAHNACGTSMTRPLAVTVNASVTPSVSIAANPGNTICSGTSVTFTATPTNGGSTPSYQWKLNGTNVGTNSATYTNAALANGNTVSCVMTSNAACTSTSTATSNTVTMTVNSSVVPAVSISANPGSTICSGTSVIFTATPTNGGTTPSYQWKLNGTNVGTNSATYTNAALVNSDVVSCVMTSNANCASPASATSNTVTMTVSGSVAPAVSIAANPGSTICTGTSVTFTATPTNGGATPSYQWKLNGTNVGTNSATYTNAALANADAVSCVMTSSSGCASPTTATSNTVTITITTAVTPAVSIAAAPGSTICGGTSVTFTATPTNGGTTPSYQWKLNGGNVGTNSATYTNAALANNDQVSCVMTSNAGCLSTPTATSNTVTMTVSASVSPSVSITANPGNTVCSGTSVTFTAVAVNGGSTPAYQWQVNGVNAGTNSDTYTSSALADGDVVTCILTSNASCASSSTATSNDITMSVSGSVAPTVSIAAAPGETVCIGTNVTFTATPGNGGSSPSYQWTLNGANVGTNSDTYSNNALVTGDQVQCTMTSNSTCATTSTATSQVITMTVNNSLVPTVSASGPLTFCQGGSVELTASAAAGYVWSPGGETTQSITVDAAGVYSVTVNDGNGCSGSDAGTTVIVNALPVVTLGTFASVCDTVGAFALTGGSPSGGTYSGTGVSGSDFDPSVAGAGTFQIIYSYTNTDGCTNEAAAPLTVDNCSGGGGCTSAPDAPHYIMGPSRVYCNQTGIVYSINPVTDATSYDWTVPTGMTITSNTGTSITVDEDSSFHGGLVCVSAVNACGSSDPECRYVREGRIIISYIHGPHNVCVDDSAAVYSISPVAGAVSYAWTIGGGASLIDNGTSATVDFRTATMPWMLLRVAVTDACGNVRYRSMWIHVGHHCGDDGDHNDGDDDGDDDGDGGDRIAATSFAYEVYPNPSNGNFQIDLNADANTTAHLMIVDMFGKKVADKMITLETGGNTVSFSMNDTAPGIYIMNIEIPGVGVKTQRLVITK